MHRQTRKYHQEQWDTTVFVPTVSSSQLVLVRVRSIRRNPMFLMHPVRWQLDERQRLLVRWRLRRRTFRMGTFIQLDGLCRLQERPRQTNGVHRVISLLTFHCVLFFFLPLQNMIRRGALRMDHFLSSFQTNFQQCWTKEVTDWWKKNKLGDSLTILLMLS